MNRTEAKSLPLGQIQLGAAVVGVIGLVATILLISLNPAGFYRSYLIAFLYWVEVSLGCLGFLLLINLVQGAWGVAIQRIMAAGARLLLLMAILFVPLIFGLQQLYSWIDPTFAEERAGEALTYLSVPFFLVRAAVGFLIWIGLAFLLSSWSYSTDRADNPAVLGRAKALSAVGVVLFVLTASLAAFDWSMSLDPLWFSSIYGWLAIVRSGLAAMALAVVILALVWRREGLSAIMTQQVVDDLANVLLATVLLWTYLHFFQFLIMWYGNLPLNVRWYEPRLAGGWGAVALLLVVFHFAIPFVWLIIPEPRRSVGRLAAVGGLLLVMHLVEQIWLVTPAFSPTATFQLLDFVLPITMGACWLLAFLWMLGRQRLVPVHHPVLQQAAAHPASEPAKAPGLAA
jgi:hypothetical protein